MHTLNISNEQECDVNGSNLSDFVVDDSQPLEVYEEENNKQPEFPMSNENNYMEDDDFSTENNGSCELPLPQNTTKNSFSDDDTSSVSSFCDDIQMDAELNVEWKNSSPHCRL